MNHLDDLSAQQFLDGALDIAGRAAAVAHCKECSECEALVAEYRMLAVELHRLPQPAAPIDFTRKVMVRVDKLESARSIQRRIALGTLGFSTLAASVAFWLAGDAALARLISNWSTELTQVSATVHVAGAVIVPMVSALRLWVLAGVTVVCVPSLMAMIRFIAKSQPESVVS
jgi:anti-sigma factor RsiW